MKIRGDLLDRSDRDVVGEEGVQAAEEAAGLDRVLGAEVGDLTEGVDSGVGSRGRDEPDGVAEDLRQSPLNLTLASAAVGLNLPTRELAPAVFDQELKVSRRGGWLRAARWSCRHSLHPTNEPGTRPVAGGASGQERAFQGEMEPCPCC